MWGTNQAKFFLGRSRVGKKGEEAKEQTRLFWMVVTAGKEIEPGKNNCPSFQNKIHNNPSNRGSHLLQGPWALYHSLAQGTGRSKTTPGGPARSVAHLAIIELLLYASGKFPEVRPTTQGRRGTVCP